MVPSVSALRSRRTLLLGVTFVVAFCSIAYELVYSELLRVIFGGTVVRYSITIGLFLSSLGVGAFLFGYADLGERDFLAIELALAVVGPLGLVYVVLLNAAVVPRPWTGGLDPLIAQAVLALSHLPVVAVGVLSGLEVPLLTALTDEVTDRGDGAGADGPGAGTGDSRPAAGDDAGADAPDPEPRADGGGPGADAAAGDGGAGSFSTVLGVDYVGSLAGTVVWALVLYPSLGLVPAVFLLGLLNAGAAVAFRTRFATGSRVLLAACLVVASVYGGVLAVDERVESSLSEAYLGAEIRAEYPPGAVDVTVRERFRTRYQEVLLYERDRAAFGGTETCLRLDMQRQFCDSWVDSYHAGLVDVPMTAFENPEDRRVLLVGGGDWIAVNHLRAYGVAVDQVDLDGEFLNYTRDHPFFERYHEDAYEYDRLNTTVADAYSYLRRTDREYDLVVLDLPGARNDDALPLYSTEFYALVREHLTEDGFVVTWSYSRYAFPEHHKAYLATVRAAGFRYYAPYRTYDDLREAPGPEIGEGFYLLSPGPRPSVVPNRSESARVRRAADRYRDVAWRPVPRYRGVEPNSVFDPNYAIVVER